VQAEEHLGRPLVDWEELELSGLLKWGILTKYGQLPWKMGNVPEEFVK
jgi:hypothetical protein